MSEGHNIRPFKIETAAFTSLFRLHYPSLKAYACLFVEDDAAEDIVQDVFIYVWEQKANITIHTSIKAYLFKATYTRCLNYLNRQKMMAMNHRKIESELKDYEARFFDPDKNEIIRKLYMNDLRDEINQAIESLPEKCRQVFTMSYLMDKQNKEISKVLEISLSTVEKHINYALKVLRHLLKNKIVAFLIAFFI
jgi:RNA polymerase sigma-70 factor, ECF subfamily